MNLQDNEGMVSVIVPVYNTERYLGRCLDSIINNDYKDLEIVCVNDGSTDNSLSILKDYCQHDSRIVLVDKPNEGISSARNAGLDTVKGEWVSFIDSDDCIHKSFFSALVNQARMRSADISICGYIPFTETVNDLYVESDEWKELIVDQIMMSSIGDKVWGRVYKRSAIQGFRFAEEINYIEDTAFNIFVHSNQDVKAIVTDTPLYYYYQRSSGLVSSHLPFDYFPVIDWLLNNLYRMKRKEYAIQRALGWALECRYELMVAHAEKVLIAQSKQRIMKVAKELMAEKSIQTSVKTKYLIAAALPHLYRLRLIYNDRSMLAFEKQIKQRYSVWKERKRNDS